MPCDILRLHVLQMTQEQRSGLLLPKLTIVVRLQPHILVTLAEPLRDMALIAPSCCVDSPVLSVTSGKAVISSIFWVKAIIFH